MLDKIYEHWNWTVSSALTTTANGSFNRVARKLAVYRNATYSMIENWNGRYQVIAILDARNWNSKRVLVYVA